MLPSNPPHTTSPGRLFSHVLSLIPSRATLHTLISLHAATSPSPCFTKRAHISGRAKTRDIAQSSAAVVLGTMMRRVRGWHLFFNYYCWLEDGACTCVVS